MSDTSPTESLAETSAPPTVLVVDDDKELADTYAMWLSDRCEVETAYGAVQARKRLAEDLDVVLLDRRMPGISGDEVLEDIREAGIDCRVGMLTAVEPDTDIIDLPFDEYLVKPATQSELRETVDDLLLRAELDSEAQEYFAKESKSEALADRHEANLRDPTAVAELEGDIERISASERIQELQAQLDRLQRITAVIRDIDQQLVVATSRAEIERTVCERLVEADPYELAWIGEYTVGFDRATPRVMAGHEASMDEQASTSGEGPIPAAVDADEVRVVEDMADRGQQLLDPIDAEAAAEAVAAGAVIPLRYRDTVYGVLCLCTDAVDVFDDREIAVLSELGDSVANAINSVETKKLLLSEMVVELEFEIRDPADVFVSLSDATDARIELKGFVPAADGELTTYLAVTDATTEAFLNTATERSAVQRIRGISNTGDEHLYECRVSGSTAVRTVIDAGADVDSMCVNDGVGYLTAIVAPETDVRTIVETVRAEFAETELVAKRETERNLQSTDDFRQSLENRLTDRQYSVLRAAYSAGYFDWPRGSTAKEIANSLDLAPPTLHEHLRGAQKQLIETFFEETGELDATDDRHADDE